MIWVARAELAAKLNVTFTPGCAASNCWPSVVKASFSDEAANTVMDPDSAGDEEVLAVGVAGLPELLLDPHPATADAAIPAAIRVMAVRRTENSCTQVSPGEISGSRGSR
jgi:hypothetical protein